MTDTQRNDPVIAHPLRDTGEQPTVEDPPKYDDVKVNSHPPVQNPPQAAVIVTSSHEPFDTVPVERTCTKCHQQILTRIEKKSGLVPWAVCGGLVLVGCWLGCCLIPFCIDDIKDTRHFCPRCGTLLGEKKLIS